MSKLQQALNVFGLSGDLTEKDIKRAYKQAALKYHPDRNPLGTELMKAVNAAFDFLMANLDKINQYQSTDESEHYHYGEALESVLNSLSALDGITFFVAGNWVWIEGETKTHKDALKLLGCKWAPKKQMWFYRPEEYKARKNNKEYTIDEIKEKHGYSGHIKARGFKRVENRM
ncbi:DnaJ domain-containing protein [Morganella morganii]|uniref:J domain-containing protein n=1 Tax=Morganella morganii TaxID=582 RepID=UPI00164974E1|nr:J domain-containing protein [Morganella morganii]MBC3997497.1 DnaJ domain-containing protein [Morganella morganii]